MTNIFHGAPILVLYSL
ncbi:hypothetical protein A2U01_0103316, partial [Trifolium medium]|nr:hypothetical protein [Trifolium medium]